MKYSLKKKNENGLKREEPRNTLSGVVHHKPHSYLSFIPNVAPLFFFFLSPHRHCHLCLSLSALSLSLHLSLPPQPATIHAISSLSLLHRETSSLRVPSLSMPLPHQFPSPYYRWDLRRFAAAGLSLVVERLSGGG